MARGDFPSAKQDQFVVRFPDGMRDRLKESAEAAGRSMNAEIVACLDEIEPLRAKVAHREEQLSISQMELRKARRERDNLRADVENWKNLVDEGAVKRIRDLEVLLEARNQRVEELYDDLQAARRSIADRLETIENLLREGKS